MKLRVTSYIKTKPTPPQMAFLSWNGLDAFYGGAAGGGKSEALLMGALQYVDIPDYAAIILRKSYTDLALPGALMDRAKGWLVDSDAHWNRENHTWTFPSGASLTFGYIQTPADRWRYQSSEFQYIGWDEVTEFDDDESFTFMFSRLRLTKVMKAAGVPLRVRAASNPVGRGATWVRKRYLENDPEPFRLDFDREGNATKIIDYSQRLFLPAKFTDNPHIDHESYLLSLSQLPQATQDRLIDGSWEIIDDAAFPEFNEDIHVIDEIAVPQNWRRWEGMDHGVTNPTAWYTAGLSSTGHAVIYGEYYSPGLISQHSSAILTLRANRWGQPSLALCDPSIRNQTGFGQPQGRGDTVHSEYSKNGIYLIPANNDRREGRVRISELLRQDPSLPYPDWHPRAGHYGSPRLFITKNCANLIEQIKYAPLDAVEGETIDPFWETRHGHAMAACRYLMTAKVFPESRDEVWQYDRAGRTDRSFGEWSRGSEWKELL